MKKVALFLLLFVLIIPSISSAIITNQNISQSNTYSVDISGNGDFTSIQDAINSASNGDTIVVRQGEYHEQIIIDKSLTLTGENKENTIIKGIAKKDVIYITAEQVSISNIQVCNSGKSGRDAGIETIANRTSITNTIIKNSTIGIFLFHSSNNIIKDNILINNKDYGLHLFYSYFNTITQNIVSNNRWGMLFVYGQGNSVSENQIAENKIHGIWLLRGSVYNTFTENLIQYNKNKGIHIQLFCFNNSFINNQISNNGEGMRIGSHWSCDNNLIQHNNILDNEGYGIILADSLNTRVIENNFINNTIHAYFKDCENSYWNQNYWGKSINSALLIKGKKNNLPWFNIDWNPASNPHEIKSNITHNNINQPITSIINNYHTFPESFSWTNVNGYDYTSPVKNQIPTPTCEAYALCAVLETLVHNEINQNIGCDLSEAHLFFYPGGTADWGVDVTEPAEYLINYGVPDEGCFPDPHRPYDFPYESISGWENRTIKIEEWGWVDNDVNAIKHALINYGPLVICQMTRRDLDYYHNGVYTPSLKSPIQRGHVTAIFGYDDFEECWLVRNSAGETWGEGGYFRISYQGFEELFSFIYPFYGGTGILYIDGVFGNFNPDVPILNIVTPQCYYTYINEIKFSTIFPYLSSIQSAAPRIYGDMDILVETENTDYVEFYLDHIFQIKDDSEPFTWKLSCTKGLHVLEVIAYKNEIISKDIIDIYIL
jgi:parallel beta-helix repeat protein